MRNELDEVEFGSRVKIGFLVLSPAVQTKIAGVLIKARDEARDHIGYTVYKEALNQYQRLIYLNAGEVVVDDREK